MKKPQLKIEVQSAADIRKPAHISVLRASRPSLDHLSVSDRAMPRAPVDSMGPMRFNSKDKRAPLLHQTPSSPYDSMVMDDMHGVSKQLPIAEIKHRHFILGCQVPRHGATLGDEGAH